MNENLLETTLQMLKQRPSEVTLPMVAERAGVKYDWLTALLYGRIRHPSVVRVQKLHDYLSGLQKSAAA